MAYETPTYYGFKVNNNLSDVIDKNLALKRLNLNIGDLDIIRGAASEEGATRDDLIAVSDLDEPLYKSLDRYIADSGTYRVTLDASGGVDSALRGNLIVNGPVGASALRYQFVDFSIRMNYTTGTGTFVLNERVTSGTNSGIVKQIESGYIIIKDLVGEITNGATFTGSYSGATLVVASFVQTKALKYTDISTSRTSAWSSALPSDDAPITYGGQLRIANGGTVTVDSIIWGQSAVERLKKQGQVPITAEIPTHTITTTINGSTVKLYAMKSIPLKFTGFFRRFDGTVNITAIPGITAPRVSWRIINVNDPADIQFYPDFGAATRSFLRYLSISAAQRNVEIYYHPDYITNLTLPSMGIEKLPDAQLSTLTRLYVQGNAIKDMPDIKIFAPVLQDLQLFDNSLFLATDPTLRSFTPQVAAKLPQTLTTLRMRRTFNGSIRQVNASDVDIPAGDPALGGANSYSVIEKACPALITFDVSRGTNEATGARFGPDSYDPNGYLPSMPNSLEVYDAAGNDFRKVPARGLKDLTNLKRLFLNRNENLTDDSTFSIASNVIEQVWMGNTRLTIPDLKLKATLQTFENQFGLNAGAFHTDLNSDVSYKFSGCSALKQFYMYASTVSGFIPKFKGNTSLDYADFFGSNRLTGGRPNNGEHGYADGNTYALYKDTFADARSIRFFRVQSNSLLIGKGIEPNTFKNLSSLYYLYWVSSGRTGAGVQDMPLPDTSSCPSLQYLIMPANNFTGPVPTMGTNNAIYYIDLSSNRLTGSVPLFNNRLLLEFVYLNSNQLSSFTGFANAPKLRIVFLQNNQITGNIPMLSESGGAPNIQQLFIFNNLFTGYTIGSFAGLTKLQRLDASGNRLRATDINNIIDDLYRNYTAAPRRGVNINIRGQSNAVGYVPSPSGLQREAEVAEKITFLRANGWTITIG